MSTIQIRGLAVRRGTRTVLEAVELTLQTANLIAILGPNGAGKSSLLACMAGLLSPQRGRIELDGIDIGALPSAERARRIAFLPQSPEVAWPIDVATLVGLGRIPHVGEASDIENRAAVERALRLTNTAQWAERNVLELSGGERARVLLARVLASESQWLLADEPFAGLDPAHQFEAAALLRAFAQRGGGVVLTIHDLSLAARIADQIVVLHRGTVVAAGPTAAALTPALIQEVYGVQAEWHPHRGASHLVIHPGDMTDS
jgi:iron complex transport system ATP-binding protein